MKIILFIFISCLVFITIEWKKLDYINVFELLKQSKLSRYISEKINILYDKKIINLDKKYMGTLKIISISIILFVTSVLILYLYVKVLSTAILLSIPVLILPVIISNLAIEINKQKINKQIPFYAINIKNQMKDENNIVQAIKKAKVEEPLAKHINEFTANVFNGMNVINAFNILKKRVEVKEFTELINSFEACYKNGGDFVEIIEKYILLKTKERLIKEETKEKVFSSVITLIIMNVLNIIVIITFVFENVEYADSVRNTVVGHSILNLNVITYMITGIIIAKMYKEE